MGITAKFPRSLKFAKYYLGHLPENEVNEVDVLAGAFFLTRKSVLDKTGGFDEAFFMYGEDIDLSYRIQQAGYKNYYFPRVTIIHFKGESTKKGNLDYVRVFYKAMSIFVNKHYSGRRSKWFSFFVQSAITLRSIPPAVRIIFKTREKEVPPSNLQTLIIGSEEAAARIQEILENKSNTQRAYTVLPVLDNGIPVDVQEVIYCEKGIPYKFIIHMLDALPFKIAFRFFDENTNVIIGSDSKNKSGIVIV
jgi:GT2 family glycosyltransferase